MPNVLRVVICIFEELEKLQKLQVTSYLVQLESLKSRYTTSEFQFPRCSFYAYRKRRKSSLRRNLIGVKEMRRLV